METWGNRWGVIVLRRKPNIQVEFVNFMSRLKRLNTGFPFAALAGVNFYARRWKSAEARTITTG